MTAVFSTRSILRWSALGIAIAAFAILFAAGQSGVASANQNKANGANKATPAGCTFYNDNPLGIGAKKNVLICESTIVDVDVSVTVTSANIGATETDVDVTEELVVLGEELVTKECAIGHQSNGNFGYQQRTQFTGYTETTSVTTSSTDVSFTEETTTTTTVTVVATVYSGNNTNSEVIGSYDVSSSSSSVTEVTGQWTETVTATDVEVSQGETTTWWSGGWGPCLSPSDF